MKLLLLGGPRFLGRAIADAALERGHELTFFNRGTTNPELYPEVERIVGDRKEGLDGLGGREWDAVVDTCGYLPRDVRASADALAESSVYCFISSVSVYADFSTPANEDSPVAELGDLPDDEVKNESYGPLKALCESAVRDVFGERALVVRPGLIVGPHDPTGRFTYWPHRVARGGEVLAPGPPERPTQVIDVRDLAEWTISLCEQRNSGTYNATHPGVALSELLETCRVVTSSDARPTWVTDEFLLEHGVGEWMELPLWLADPALAAADRVDVRRAIGAGLAFRALEETVRATLAHAETVDGVGLTANRESELLATWHGPSKDYSGTPLSQKLGAKPGAGVVVFFTTTREELERRFDSLKATLDPADGLWIAWPKKAAKIDGDLTFEAVQEIGLAHGLVDNKSCSVDERWQALRFVYRLTDRP